MLNYVLPGSLYRWNIELFTDLLAEQVGQFAVPSYRSALVVGRVQIDGVVASFTHENATMALQMLDQHQPLHSDHLQVRPRNIAARIVHRRLLLVCKEQLLHGIPKIVKEFLLRAPLRDHFRKFLQLPYEPPVR